MSRDQTRHTAKRISSPAELETLDTYETRIPFYEEQDFTYIPMPNDGLYYDTHEKSLQELEDSQYISPNIHLLEVLELLLEEPFLLVDSDHNKFVIVRDHDEEPLLIRSRRDVQHRMSVENFNDSFTWGNFEFNQSDVTTYRIDDFLATGMTLKDQMEGLVTPTDERFQIITIADVNSRRMKDMLYQSLAELAAGLGNKIEQEYPDSESTFKYISPNPIGRWKKDQIQGLNLHIAEHLNLIDMLQVIQASDRDFVESCGFESKNDVSTLSKINQIRNSVMHANRSLIYDREDISRVLEVVNEADRIVSNMEGIEKL